VTIKYSEVVVSGQICFDRAVSIFSIERIMADSEL
jgi:hypothetical protein